MNWNAVKKSAAIVTAAAAISGALAVTAIVAFEGESSASAKASFCESLDDYASTVVSYQGLDPVTATNDEVDAAADDIADAWNDVVIDFEDWANADDNALTDAYYDLYDAVQSLPGDNTAAENIAAVQPELDAFPAAFHQTFDGTGCSTV